MRTLIAFSVLLASGVAEAGNQCVSVGVDFTPTDSLQIVAWVTTASGEYVDTIYMTAKTGIYGLGNRPGRFDFNSGPIPDPARGIDDMWPYGRRITTFPVWAHAHGMTFPEVAFQNGAENDLSHSTTQSSTEHLPYCRPISPDGTFQCGGPGDKTIWDTGTCASAAYTDKGVFTANTSLYPPRADLNPQAQDSPSVAMYREINPFDAISKATPKGGTPMTINWPVPEDALPGDYVLWIEASKEFDFNATYNSTVYPAPTNIGYAACGMPYRGQPSVVYKVPFTVSPQAMSASTVDYVGYGDADGATGTLHAPDATITTDTPGSGALRLQLVSDGGMYRVRVRTSPQDDPSAPSAPTSLEPVDVASTAATLRFVEPGDDGATGTAASYEIRIRASTEITEDNFKDSMPVVASVAPSGAGQVATFELAGLLPETDYWVGIRALDDCFNPGPLAIVHFTTPEIVPGAVDACFVATAAYGSMMANDVETLRNFRDSLLSRTVLGELFVETYYTFGPAAAGIVGQSELLRSSARAVLAPIVDAVRRLTY
jgi:hypothetical protein